MSEPIEDIFDEGERRVESVGREVERRAESIGREVKRAGRKIEKEASRAARALGLKAPKSSGSGSASDILGQAPSFEREGAAAAERERLRLARKKGRASTILAGRRASGRGVARIFSQSP